MRPCGLNVDNLIGKPYARGGRGPDAYDCAGLVVEVMRRRGIKLSIPETPEAECDQLAAMRAILAAQWVDVPRAFAGCIVFFRSNHVAVMLSPTKFIHVAEDVGQVCIERLEGAIWPRRFVGFYEYGGAKR